MVLGLLFPAETVSVRSVGNFDTDPREFESEVGVLFVPLNHFGILHMKASPGNWHSKNSRLGSCAQMVSSSSLFLVQNLLVAVPVWIHRGGYHAFRTEDCVPMI